MNLEQLFFSQPIMPLLLISKDPGAAFIDLSRSAGQRRSSLVPLKVFLEENGRQLVHPLGRQIRPDTEPHLLHLHIDPDTLWLPRPEAFHFNEF